MEGEELQPFTLEDLKKELESTQDEKGVNANPRCFLHTYNRCVKDDEFPVAWMRGMLVVIPKPRKGNEGQIYRSPSPDSALVGGGWLLSLGFWDQIHRIPGFLRAGRLGGGCLFVLII